MSIRAVALVSLIYDALIGVALLFFQEPIVSGLGLAPPNYLVNGNLNGLFALAVGIGLAVIVASAGFVHKRATDSLS